MSAQKPLNGTKCLNGPEPDRGDWILGADREDIVSILDNAPYGIVINSSTGDGDVLYINHETHNLMGYKVSEVATGLKAQRTFSENPDHLQEMQEFKDSLRKTGKAFAAHRVVTRSGQLKHLDVQSVLLRSGNVVSMWTDVTRREAAEQELRESENKFRTLFEHSSDAVLLFRDGHILDCNKAAERAFRAEDREQLLNCAVDQLSPTKQADGRLSSNCANELFSSALEKKSPHFEWWLKCFDGHIFPAEVAATKIQLQGQPVLYVILRDITAWKNSEQALLEARDRLEDRVNERTSKLRAVNRKLRQEIRRRESIESDLERSREELRLLSEHLQRAREEERQRIAREVHDELGQFLSALKIDVTCLGKATPTDSDELLRQTRNMEQLIDNAIHSVRHICSELRPSILDDFGLPAAIEWYLGDFQKRTGIRCSAAIDPDIPEEKKGLRLMLFRVFQEAMTNILRHAGATRVNADLKIESGTLTLRVKDNGKGITRSQMENPRSFGITGIRERVRFWGGHAHFEGAPNQGATMTVTIPLREEKKVLS